MSNIQNAISFKLDTLLVDINAHLLYATIWIGLYK